MCTGHHLVLTSQCEFGSVVVVMTGTGGGWELSRVVHARAGPHSAGVCVLSSGGKAKVCGQPLACTLKISGTLGVPSQIHIRLAGIYGGSQTLPG